MSAGVMHMPARQSHYCPSRQRPVATPGPSPKRGAVHPRQVRRHLD